ncbi:MAG: hypothetical protein U0Z75_06190 [Deinococcaceae bacterium]
MNEQRDQAKKRFQESVDLLVQKTDLHLKMQKKPVKMMGGSATGGFLFGFLFGRRGRKIQKVYVERGALQPIAKKKTETKKIPPWKGLQSAATGMLFTVFFNIVQEKLLAPFLETYADQLIEKGKDIDAKNKGKKH